MSASSMGRSDGRTSPPPSESALSSIGATLGAPLRALRGRFHRAPSSRERNASGGNAAQEADLAAFLTEQLPPPAAPPLRRLERSNSIDMELAGFELPPMQTDLQPPLPLTEASVHDLVGAFARKKLPHKSFVSELLRRQLELLQALPNVPRAEVPPGAHLCVVGDLHGQFADLIHIFRLHGFPSPSTPYLFNGDFVDRGVYGVEVTLTLFAFQQLHPTSVYLNRGNHEEKSVHSVYGFQHECVSKYDKFVYEAFAAAFEHLPLATIVNDAVFVVHGARARRRPARPPRPPPGVRAPLLLRAARATSPSPRPASHQPRRPTAPQAASTTISPSTSSTTLRAPNTSSMPPAPAARGAGGSSTLTCARRWRS